MLAIALLLLVTCGGSMDTPAQAVHQVRIISPTNVSRSCVKGVPLKIQMDSAIALHQRCRVQIIVNGAPAYETECRDSISLHLSRLPSASKQELFVLTSFDSHRSLQAVRFYCLADPKLTPQLPRVPKGRSRTVIMAMSQNHDIADFRSFIIPLRAVYRGDIILFVPIPFPPSLGAMFLIYDIQIRAIPYDNHVQCAAGTTSFNAFAKACATYNWCFAVSTIKNVLFQANPFPSVPPGVHLVLQEFSTSTKIGTSPQTCRHIELCWGSTFLRLVQNETQILGGAVMGTPHAFGILRDTIHEEVAGLAKRASQACMSSSCDSTWLQTILMYCYFSGSIASLKIVVQPHGQGLAQFSGDSEFDWFVNSDGTPAPVVHAQQLDNSEGLHNLASGKAGGLPADAFPKALALLAVNSWQPDLLQQVKTLLHLAIEHDPSNLVAIASLGSVKHHLKETPSSDVLFQYMKVLPPTQVLCVPQHEMSGARNTSLSRIAFDPSGPLVRLLVFTAVCDGNEVHLLVFVSREVTQKFGNHAVMTQQHQMSLKSFVCVFAVQSSSAHTINVREPVVVIEDPPFKAHVHCRIPQSSDGVKKLPTSLHLEGTLDGEHTSVPIKLCAPYHDQFELRERDRESPSEKVPTLSKVAICTHALYLSAGLPATRLIEWMAYHELVGVGHFHIYHRGADVVEVLQDYVARGLTLTPTLTLFT